MNEITTNCFRTLTVEIDPVDGYWRSWGNGVIDARLVRLYNLSIEYRERTARDEVEGLTYRRLILADKEFQDISEEVSRVSSLLDTQGLNKTHIRTCYCCG